MNQAEVEAFVVGLENVSRTENYGYIFYLIGDDDRMPFTTIANTDAEYDNVSHLDRDGVFRVNIGISKDTFEAMFGDAPSDAIDYTTLDTFMPHPDYAREHFICILSPSGDNEGRIKELISEAHSIAARRYARQAGKRA